MGLVARTRAFDIGEAADRAMQVFWIHGYEATSVEDLVAATGLSRSSIYQAYGSKEGLFDAALRAYLAAIEAKLAALESNGGGLDDVAAFFTNVGTDKSVAGDSQRCSRGCFVVNSIAELAQTTPWIKQMGDAYQDRLRQAFIRVLAVAADRGEIAASSIERRANLLTFTTLGFFVAARGAPADAIAAHADEVIAEIETWREAV